MLLKSLPRRRGDHHVPPIGAVHGGTKNVREWPRSWVPAEYRWAASPGSGRGLRAPFTIELAHPGRHVGLAGRHVGPADTELDEPAHLAVSIRGRCRSRLVADNLGLSLRLPLDRSRNALSVAAS